MKGQGGTPFWNARTNQIDFEPVVLDLKYTCRRNYCDRARVRTEAICFAGTENVQILINTEQNIVVDRPLKEVKVGDKILVMKGDGSNKFLFSPVIALPHAYNEYPTNFMQIITKNTDLKLTQLHLIMGSTFECASIHDMNDFNLLTAVTLTVGSCILTLEGPEEIIEINLEHGYGIYSAITYETNSLLVVYLPFMII